MLKGTYLADRDLSKLNLSGAGLKAVIQALGSDFAIQTMKAKILGQGLTQ